MLQRNAGTPSRSSSGALRRDEGPAPSVSELLTSSRLALPGELPMAQLETTVVGDQYLIFSLLDRDLGILAEHIQGVERLADVTPVPNVAAWVKGVINLRGSIASVVDLRAFLDLEVLPYNPRTRLLSVQYNEMVICLVVDSVSEMVPIPPASVVTDLQRAGIPHRLAPYTSGSAQVGKRNVMLIDVAQLLFSEKMQRYA